MIRITPRRARRPHLCEYGAPYHKIRPGDPYLEHVISPHHDDIDNTTWWRAYECAECALRHGRKGILHP